MAKRQLEDDDEWCDDCEDYIYGQSSHYHCSNCGKVVGMMSHFNFDSNKFTCMKKIARNK